jgi:hypothetical protein
MYTTHMRAVLIAAAAALTGLPALAEPHHPGTLCTSDGPVGRSVTGLMVNKATAPNATTYFQCPIIRTQDASIFPSTLTVAVNVKTNPSTAEFNCYMRSVTANNVTYDTAKAVFASSFFNGGYTTVNYTVSLPAVLPAAVNMRCSVPNVTSGIEAGMVSYRVVGP